MVNFNNFIQTGVALCLEIGVGLLLSKLHIVNSKAATPLNRFIFYTGFIPLIFRNLARNKLSEIDFKPLGINGMSTIGCLFLLSFLFFIPGLEDKFGVFLATELPALYINYVIIGLPVFNSIWGEENNSIVGIICLANDCISSPLYFLLAAIYDLIRKNKQHIEFGEPAEKFTFKTLLNIFKTVLTAPVVIGIIISFIWLATGLKQPIFLKRLIDLFADSVLFMSLFCVGCFLSEHSLISCPWWQFLLCLVFRHFVTPIVCGLFCWAFKTSNTVARQCILMIALPTAVASYSLSVKTGIGTGCASTMIFWSTIASVPAILIIFSIMDAAKVFPEK